MPKRGFGLESDLEFYRNRKDINGQVYLNHPTNNNITAMTPVGRSVVRCLMPLILLKSSVYLLVRLNNNNFLYQYRSQPMALQLLERLRYFLECSADEPIATLNFQWLRPSDGRTPLVSSSSVTTNSTYSTSQLHFRSLQQSHNGLCSCHTTINETESTFLSHATKGSYIT